MSFELTCAVIVAVGNTHEFDPCSVFQRVETPLKRIALRSALVFAIAAVQLGWPAQKVPPAFARAASKKGWAVTAAGAVPSFGNCWYRLAKAEANCWPPSVVM